MFPPVKWLKTESDANTRHGSVDHDTYVRAQIWLEKIRDWNTSNERLKRDP